MRRPLVIDIEASGFGRGSYPIEVGVALGGGETKCIIIRPEPEWQHWDPQAELLHGLSREILIRHGCSPRDVATRLNELLGGELVYSDAWGNDSSWLGLLFDCAQISQRFKLEPLRSILTESQMGLWHQTKDHITDGARGRRHRASNDALILQKTFCRTAELSRGR